MDFSVDLRNFLRRMIGKKSKALFNKAFEDYNQMSEPDFYERIFFRPAGLDD